MQKGFSHESILFLGAILSPHVDRYPLVTSCIINVAQDVDEPWPLEVYDRQGKAVNVTMEAGDIVFYESHSLIHGRPFPLRGRCVIISCVSNKQCLLILMCVFLLIFVHQVLCQYFCSL
jgi:hypothetical protein